MFRPLKAVTVLWIRLVAHSRKLRNQQGERTMGGGSSEIRTRVSALSDCLSSQAICHGLRSRSMAFSMVRSFRMATVSASLPRPVGAPRTIRRYHRGRSFIPSPDSCRHLFSPSRKWISYWAAAKACCTATTSWLRTDSTSSNGAVQTRTSKCREQSPSPERQTNSAGSVNTLGCRRRPHGGAA